MVYSGLNLHTEISVSLGYWYTFGWVMSMPVTIAIAVLGLLYLGITMLANQFKREGLRLWLYRCNWGLGAIPEWQDEKGHSERMRTLLETLQRPIVLRPRRTVNAGCQRCLCGQCHCGAVGNACVASGAHASNLAHPAH